MPILKRNEVTLPPKTRETILKARELQLRALDDALDMVPRSVEDDAKRAIGRIIDSGYNTKVVRRELRSLVNGHFRNIRESLGELIGDILTHEGVANKAQLAWELSQRKALAGTGGRLRLSTDAVTAELGAKMATVRKLRWTPKTRIEKEASKHIRPWKSSRKLSTRLHRAKKNALSDANRLALRAVRNGRTMQATNDLIIGMADRGVELGGSKKLPKYIKRFVDAGNNLARAGKDKTALRTWRNERRRIRRYMGRLAEGGRTQNALLELLQRTTDKSPKGMSRALDVVVNQRQHYVAERILETEAHGAMRSAQAIRDKEKPYITGYRWHLSASSRKDFVRKVSPTRILPIPPKIPPRLGGKRRGRKRGRGRCICEGMNGREVSVDWLAAHPHGGHPYCRCWFEPIYSRGAMRDMPLTRNEERLMSDLGV